MLRIPQGSSITGTSPSDWLVLYTGHSLGVGVLPLCRGAVDVFYSSSRLGNLPCWEEIVNKLAENIIFSTFDLKWAHHQILLQQHEMKFTAFEANKKLIQYRRSPFGVTNEVVVFLRKMDKLIQEQALKDMFTYIDKITVTGRNQKEHEWNVKRFFTIIKAENLTLNEIKTVSSLPALNFLGYCVGNGIIKPDPERLRPL